MSSRFAGDYVRLPMDSWPIPGRTGFQGPPARILFWAQPDFSKAKTDVRFLAAKEWPFGMIDEGELKKFWWAPDLGYFLEQGIITYHLEMGEAELQEMKRMLLSRWGYAHLEVAICR